MNKFSLLSNYILTTDYTDIHANTWDK